MSDLKVAYGRYSFLFMFILAFSKLLALLHQILYHQPMFYPSSGRKIL